MKILIPENCVLWTTKGLCFPKDLIYGTEIFTIDPQNKLAITPIMDVEEPELMKVQTIFTENNISTTIPHYKIQLGKESIQIKDIKKEQTVEFVDAKYLVEYKEYQDNHAVELIEKSPFSTIVASYLASSEIKKGREQVFFTFQDEKEAQKFNNQIQEQLISEIGGSTGFKLAAKDGYGRHYAKFLIIYYSEKFYKFRKSINLMDDKILNSIYQNGIGVYFGFLRSLLGKGFTNQLNYFQRGGDEKNIVLNLPWKNFVRKLLQNSCYLWNTYQLSSYKTKSQMNINEVKIKRKTQSFSEEPILEIKDHLMNCYEIEIPIGNKIITDNLIIKPFELTEEEIEELKKFEEKTDLELEEIRKNITALISNEKYILKTIGQFQSTSKEFNLHVVGIIKSKGKVSSTTTKYGETISVNAILFDESGEIKMKLWGEIADEIKEGNVLELFNARTQNGILYNTRKEGWEKIHKLGERG